MSNKIQFFSKFYSFAMKDIERYGLRSSVAEVLENMWIQSVQWHKENDERVYRESLTLDQLARL